MLKEDRQVIHLEIKETGEHHYFGSVSALFAVFENLMGMKFQTFRAKAKDIFTETTPFENDKVIVRKGKLKTIGYSSKLIHLE
ncbi:MAG: hypothetical protein IKY67_08605 [Paludibacteraceae bacterium]|nr:hypothetical protein [Paludibacteraceae bacterium]